MTQHYPEQAALHLAVPHTLSPALTDETLLLAHPWAEALPHRQIWGTRAPGTTFLGSGACLHPPAVALRGEISPPLLALVRLRLSRPVFSPPQDPEPQTRTVSVRRAGRPAAPQPVAPAAPALPALPVPRTLAELLDRDPLPGTVVTGTESGAHILGSRGQWFLLEPDWAGFLGVTLLSSRHGLDLDEHQGRAGTRAPVCVTLSMPATERSPAAVHTRSLSGPGIVFEHELALFLSALGAPLGLPPLLHRQLLRGVLFAEEGLCVTTGPGIALRAGAYTLTVSQAWNDESLHAAPSAHDPLPGALRAEQGN